MKGRSSAIKRVCCVALAGMLAFGGCGQQQEAGRKPEDVALLEPVGAALSYETAARRNLYNASAYFAQICPYTEEYQLSGSFQFAGYDVLPGNPVERGGVLLHGDLSGYQDRLDALEETIEDMDQTHQEFVEENRKEWEKQNSDVQAYGQAIETMKERKPKEPVDAEGNPVSDPAYAQQYQAWESENSVYESRYHRALQRVMELDEALKEETELYELDRAYQVLQEDRLKEDAKNGKLFSGMSGYVSAVSALNGGQMVPSNQGLAAVSDPARLEIRCQYITKSEVDGAEDFYALCAGKRYEVEYHPYESSEEYNKAKERNGGTVYSVLQITSDASDLKPGTPVVVILKKKTRENVITVPNSALEQEGNLSYVYVIRDDQYVHTQVTTGFSDGVYTEILSGVEEGDKIRTEQPPTAGTDTAKVVRGQLHTDFQSTGWLYYTSTDVIQNPVEYGVCYYVKTNVEVQQAVQKGDVLAQIKVVPDQVEIQRRERELARERERLQDLVQENQESNQKAIEQRQERIRQLEELLQEMNDDAQTTEIVAPHDGIIRAIRGHEENSLLNQGEELFLLSSQDLMYLEVDNQGDQLSCGMTVSVDFTDREGQKRQAQGEVVTVNGMSLSQDLNYGTVLVRFSKEDIAGMAEVSSRADEWWTPRTSFQVKAVVRQVDDVLLVPRKAVTIIGNNTYVKVRLENGEVQYRSFFSGGADGEHFWAIEGLTEGMELCLE